MPSRELVIDGRAWRVFPSGFITQYDADEYGLLFVHGSGETAEVRVTRYSPRGARSREASLAELTDADLRALFAQSQPGATSPEAGYRA
jgi:succinylarginine dihydrolase